MTDAAPFALFKRNPDVLTCIANLSNDEVFTPPEFAGRMLDTLAEGWAAANGGANLWADRSATFLDPCTKSGVFLREIATRLIAGLADEIPDLQTRVDHILTRQLFGIGITQLTALLARRSLYCSKMADGAHSVATSFSNESGNIWFERTEHDWDEGRCRYCGAGRKDYDRGESYETHAYAILHTDNVPARVAELFGAEMQFDVIIGNPPYQLGQSGGEAIGGFAMPIYQKFVRAAKQLDPRFLLMVTPSRWFAGGRGLDDYRAEMLADRRMQKLVDYPDASEAFPGTQIKGGVSYFLWSSSWEGPCEVTTFQGGAPTGPAMSRKLDAYDILVRRNEAVPILEKVLAATGRSGSSNLAAMVSPIQPFSIRTNFRGVARPDSLSDPIRLIGNGGDTFIERADIPRNDPWVDDWKVLLGRAYGAGEALPHQIYNYPIVAGPGTACSETYLVISRFKSEAEAVRFSAYLRTRFVRFLVSLRKNTQDIYNERFQFVPALPMDRTWTDDELYKRYGITSEEQSFINSMIRPMEAVD
ncbi:MAG: Eco57I restriction-modification methylase domain-containing protein [Phenylobacterium sp.]|jgi:site-specific DNA-methyltransferase (adenine-specific)|nr:Eco57I restriction-modification methylase domain-containing protein [Phenylobacterium sp.]